MCHHGSHETFTKRKLKVTQNVGCVTHCLTKWAGSSERGTDAGPRACRQVFSEARQALPCHSTLPPIWSYHIHRLKYQMRHKDCYIEQDIMMLSLFQLYLQSWLHQGRPLDQQSLDGEEQHCIHQLLDAVAWLRASVRMGSKSEKRGCWGWWNEFGSLVFPWVVLGFFLVVSPGCIDLWKKSRRHEPSLNEDSPDKSSVWGFCKGRSTSSLLASLDLDKKISISYISILCVTCFISSTCTASPFHLQFFKIETLAPSRVPASFLLLWDMTNDENMGMSLSHAHVIEFCLISRLHPCKLAQNLNMDLYYQESSAFGNHGFQPINGAHCSDPFSPQMCVIKSVLTKAIIWLILSSLLLLFFLNNVSFLLSSILVFFPWSLKTPCTDSNIAKF